MSGFDKIDRKLQSSRDSYRKMSQCLIHPTNNPHSPAHIWAQASAGAIIDHPWQRIIWVELNNTLSSAYSAPQVVRHCFGWDHGGREPIKNWLAGLQDWERQARRDFDSTYKPLLELFKQDPLSEQRHNGEHRFAWAIAKVRIQLGQDRCVWGSPTEDVDATWEIDYDDKSGIPTRGLFPRQPITPTFRDFWFMNPERPMFHECERYIAASERLVAEAKAIHAITFKGRKESVFPG